MKDKIFEITEATLVPISLVAGIMTIVWLAGHISFQNEANAKAIEELRVKQNSISEIQTDIAVIKSKLDAIERKIKN